MTRLRGSGVAAAAILAGLLAVPGSVAQAPSTLPFHAHDGLVFTLGCKESDSQKLRFLPGATGIHPVQLPAVGQALTDDNQQGNVAVGRVTAVNLIANSHFPELDVTAVGSDQACSNQGLGKTFQSTLGVAVDYTVPLIRVAPSGQIGPLRLGHSTAAQVKAFEGQPIADYRITPKNDEENRLARALGIKPPPHLIPHARALVYHWGGGFGGAQATGEFGPLEETTFLINVRTHKLSDWETLTPQFATAQGLSVDTTATQAVALAHHGLTPIQTGISVCANQAMVLPRGGHLAAALSYRAPFVILLYNTHLQDANGKPIPLNQLTADSMFMSGPGTAYPIHSKKAGGAVRPICYLKKAAHKRRRR